MSVVPAHPETRWPGPPLEATVLLCHLPGLVGVLPLATPWPGSEIRVSMALSPA